MSADSELWRRMIAASDEAIRDEPPGLRADALIAHAHLQTVMEHLFPDGAPPGPWAVAEYQIWRRLNDHIHTALAFIASCDSQPIELGACPMITSADGEAKAPPVTSLENQL